VIAGVKEVTVAVLIQLHQVLSGSGGAPMGVMEVVLVKSPSVKRFWPFVDLIKKRRLHEIIRVIRIFFMIKLFKLFKKYRAGFHVYKVSIVR
jgi:hypothetical protein